MPTFDRPGQTLNNRITLAVQGSVLLPREATDEAAIEQAFNDVGVDGAPGIQASPIEYPNEFLSMRGAWVQVEQIACEHLRAMGAKVKFDRAPGGTCLSSLVAARGGSPGQVKSAQRPRCRAGPNELDFQLADCRRCACMPSCRPCFLRVPVLGGSSSASENARLLPAFLSFLHLHQRFCSAHAGSVVASGLISGRGYATI